MHRDIVAAELEPVIAATKALAPGRRRRRSDAGAPATVITVDQAIINSIRQRYVRASWVQDSVTDPLLFLSPLPSPQLSKIPGTLLDAIQAKLTSGAAPVLSAPMDVDEEDVDMDAGESAIVEEE